MKRLAIVLVAFATLALAAPALAKSNQDHTCQGGHNCNTGGGGSTTINNYNDNSRDVTGNTYNQNQQYGGNASATGGNSSATGGNSSATSSATGGAVTSSGNSTVDVGISNLATFDPTVTNTLGQDQNQSQNANQGQDQTLVDQSRFDMDLDMGDTVWEAPDIPVNSAAPVFAGACSQGISFQGMSYGGSIASGNSVCDYVAVAGGFVSAGSRKEALRVLGKAERAADFRFAFSVIRGTLTLGLF